MHVTHSCVGENCVVLKILFFSIINVNFYVCFLILGKEKAALEKRVAYMQGQVMLSESSKKRAEESARELREQVQRLEQQLESDHKGSVFLMRKRINTQPAAFVLL